MGAAAMTPRQRFNSRLGCLYNDELFPLIADKTRELIWEGTYAFPDRDQTEIVFPLTQDLTEKLRQQRTRRGVPG